MTEILDVGFSDMAMGSALDAADRSKLAEVAEMTDIISLILISIVIFTNVMVIVLLIVQHILDRRPKHSHEILREYKTAMGKITSVTKTAYYVKPYVRKEEDEELSVKKKLKKNGGVVLSDLSEPSLVEKHSGSEVVFKTQEQLEKEKNDVLTEVKKYRYKVHYEFTVRDTGNMYSGDFFVQNESAVKEGDIIEVTYKPDDPMVNYTDYSMPAGGKRK